MNRSQRLPWSTDPRGERRGERHYGSATRGALVPGLLASLVLLGVAAGCRVGEADPAADTTADTAADPAISDPSTLSTPAVPAGTPAGPFVVALGTVQDGGLPHAGCDGANCRAARANPARRRRVASLGIVLPAARDEPARSYLIDATPDLVDQLHDLRRFAGRPPADGVDRAPLDGVFLTHAHIGHYLGLAWFGFEAIDTHGLAVWATPRMAAFLRANAPWDQLVALRNVELRELAVGGTSPGTAVTLGRGVSVAALAVPHRAEYTDTVAYLVRGPHRSLLYVPDTDGWEGWPVALEQVLAEVDTALLDGTFYSLGELPGRDLSQVRHPLISRTVERLGRSVGPRRHGAPGERPLRVLFTHLNHSNPALDPASAARRELEAAGFAVLAEGQRFPL